MNSLKLSISDLRAILFELNQDLTIKEVRDKLFSILDYDNDTYYSISNFNDIFRKYNLK